MYLFWFGNYIQLCSESLLALCSVVTPSRTQGTIWDAEHLTWVSHMQGKHPPHWCSDALVILTFNFTYHDSPITKLITEFCNPNNHRKPGFLPGLDISEVFSLKCPLQSEIIISRLSVYSKSILRNITRE